MGWFFPVWKVVKEASERIFTMQKTSELTNVVKLTGYIFTSMNSAGTR